MAEGDVEVKAACEILSQAPFFLSFILYLPSPLASSLTCCISAARSRSKSSVRFNHYPRMVLPAALGKQENVDVRQIIRMI